METGLEGRPWYFGLVVGVVVGGVLLGVGYRFKLQEMKQQIQGQEVRLGELQDQIRRGEAARAQLPAFEERVARLEEELAKLLEILPDQRLVFQIIRQLRALTEREDFTLGRVTPSVPVEQEYFYEWPIRVYLQGTYHNLARLFDRLSRYERIINVDELTISALPSQTNNRTIDASFVAKTFIYKDTQVEAPVP
ncbi:MAG TPA: type 4a pilus biogenesis protein PilO [Thermoanaerobaculia bacterium]|nr:type 4a pilus biogenesis protein PilO [Thermoanaerobaculia bacterium]